MEPLEPICDKVSLVVFWEWFYRWLKSFMGKSGLFNNRSNLFIIKNGLSKRVLNYFKKENKNGNKDKEEENK